MATVLGGSWVVPIVVALITGIVSIVVGLINYRSNRDTQKAVHDFGIQKSEHDARQDYEYKVKTRLYEEFDPYLFEFMELCENARQAISRIVKWSREGGLEYVFEDHGPKGNELTKIIYDLFAPMAAYRIFRNRLTLFDLTLFPIIGTQYRVAKIIFSTFDDDKEFARLEPQITDYIYFDEEPNRKDTDREGFDFRTIEEVAESLVNKPKPEDPNARPIVMAYNEFRDKRQNNDQNNDQNNELEHSDSFDIIANRLLGFNPETKRVFWRIMLTQAFLYKFLENSRTPEFSKYFRKHDSNTESNTKESFSFEVFKNMSMVGSDELDWQVKGQEYENKPETFTTVEKYLEDKLKALFPINR